MASAIIMPPLSQTTSDVTLLRWLVNEGDQVKQGEPLCEVETDKVTMEVESFTSGTVLQIRSEPETTVAVGAVIAVVGEPGEDISTLTSGLAGKPAEVATPSSENHHFSRHTQPAPDADQKAHVRATSAGTEVKATALVKNLARKRKIPLQNVIGTGPGGLVTRDDLARFEQRRTAAEAPSRRRVTAGAEEMLLSRNQLSVARNLTKSKAEIPHYYVKSTVYTDNLLAWREHHRLPDGAKISVTAILIHVLAKALRRHPRVNSSFQEDRLILHHSIDINCAVAVGDELHVPVITSADLKAIQEIDTELKWLAAKARNGKLESQDLLSGTFTLTNLGMYAVDEFGAIINPPQAGILAVGKMEKRLHIDEANCMTIRTACMLTGSFDHRIVNGALGAEFMSTLKQMIEAL